MSKTLNPEVVRFGKFLLVGALNTLIDFGLMNLFSGLLHMPLVLAQALSYILAVINSYVVLNFSTEAWVSFKLWGYVFPLVFLVGQGIFIAPHIQNDEAAEKEGTP